MVFMAGLLLNVLFA